MINTSFFSALEDLAKDKKVDSDTFIKHLEAGFTSAYKKDFGAARSIEVRLNAAKKEIRVFAYRTVVEVVEDEDKEITLEDAKAIKSSYKLGSKVYEEVSPKQFSRVAVQTAMQVVRQRMMDTTRDLVMEEMASKEGEIVNAIVRKVEEDTVYVELVGNQLEGVILPNDKIRGEKYEVNRQLKVYVKRVKASPRGAQVLVSRSSANFVKRLFELEVPEIANGTIVVKNCVREAGERTKIAVYSEDPTIDPMGACIGPKGSRISSIVSELNGEKVDVIHWDPEIGEFISRSLSPAPVTHCRIDDDMTAQVLVPDDKLSLAIGKSGQNARLAAKLTGWKIDVKPKSFIEDKLTTTDGGDDFVE